MKITNKRNLPGALVTAAHMDPYDRGDADVSVTDLIDSPRIFLMKTHYSDVTTVDVADNLWPMLGRAFHAMMDEGSEDDVVKEERLVEDINGLRISGAIDRLCLKDQLLTDYKLTTVAAMKKGPKPEWEKQLNCYAYLVWRKYQFWPNLQVMALIRDYRNYEAKHHKNYPPNPIARIPVKLWNPDVTFRYLHDRAAIFQDAIRDYHETGELPLCSPEERWATEDHWTVKLGPRTVISTAPTREQALLVANRYSGAGGKVAFVAGEDKRCANWCAYAPSCSQWQTISGNRGATVMMEAMTEGE